MVEGIDYDPITAQFTQPDTIMPGGGDPAGLNRVAYARNNPMRYSDPTGHCWWTPGDGACPGGDLVPEWAEELLGGIMNVIHETPEFAIDRILDEVADLLDLDKGDVLELIFAGPEAVVDTIGFVLGTAPGGEVEGACPERSTCIVGSRFPEVFGFKGQTFNEVILLTDDATDRTLRHEGAHRRQAEEYGWGAFAPAYLLDSLWQLVGGGDWYADNFFERQADDIMHGADYYGWMFWDIWDTP
jgi:hypothetical protein